MFDLLWNLFKKDVTLKGIGRVADNIEDILTVFEEDYLKDKNAKNAAIDAVIQILEQHKDK